MFQCFPSNRLIIWLPPRWVSFPMKSNSNISISDDRAVIEVDIRQLGVRITFHVRRKQSFSEIRKLHLPTLLAQVHRHISLSAHAFLSIFGSSRCSLPPLQVCTRHSGTTCITEYRIKKAVAH
ncbi:hypothetical protein TNCV_1394621 [Trichonephila clavipes]|nr:hypothetical protein TNCV_1394621 [Trichonephila clavipes]